MLVALHGLGGSAGSWIHNLDSLAEEFEVYAIDLPGFALSSRPTFDTTRDPAELEERMVAGVEAWRKAKGIEKFTLLGHSFGGYISAA